jgi:hypothetical protein
MVMVYLLGCEFNLAGLVELQHNLPLGLACWQRLVIVGEGAVDTDQLFTLRERGQWEGSERGVTGSSSSSSDSESDGLQGLTI